jgi:hypothetical protein
MVLAMSFGEALRGVVYTVDRFDYERNGVSDLFTVVLVVITGIPLVFEKWLLLRLGPSELVKFEYTYKFIELGLTFVTTGLVPLYLSKLAGDPRLADAIRSKATSFAIVWVVAMAGIVLFFQGNIASHVKAFSTFSFLVGLLVLPVMVHLAFERKRVQANVTFGDLGFYVACCVGRIILSCIVILSISQDMMAPVMFMIFGVFSLVEVVYLICGRGLSDSEVAEGLGARE